jgi:nitrous oxide reductase accessory protein NosL
MTRLLVAAAVALVTLTASPARAQLPSDVQKEPSCRHCNMDRAKFGHSRMVIEYEDGKVVGTCSVHCTAIELALSIDGAPKAIRVADMQTRQLVDAESATWVVGGSVPGVMTRRAKWAFADRSAAEAFAKESGGQLATFEEALRAAYEDMHQDVKMIREKRKAMKAKPLEAHR